MEVPASCDQGLKCRMISVDGEWRCNLMALSGKIWCDKHFVEIESRRKSKHGVQGNESGSVGHVNRPGGSKISEKESVVREGNDGGVAHSDDPEKGKAPDGKRVGKGRAMNILGESGGGLGGMETVERPKDLRYKGKLVVGERDREDNSGEAGRESGVMQWKDLGGGTQMLVVMERSVTLGSVRGINIEDATIKKRDEQRKPKLSKNKSTNAQEIERTGLEGYVSYDDFCQNVDSLQFASHIAGLNIRQEGKIMVGGSAENAFVDINSGEDWIAKKMSHSKRPRGSRDLQRQVISGTTSKGIACLSQKVAIEEPKETKYRIDMEPRDENDHGACVGTASAGDGGSRGIAAVELNGSMKKHDTQKTLKDRENAARALFYSGQIIARGFGVVQDYRQGGSQGSKNKKTLAALENQVATNRGDVCGSSKQSECPLHN